MDWNCRLLKCLMQTFTICLWSKMPSTGSSKSQGQSQGHKLVNSEGHLKVLDPSNIHSYENKQWCLTRSNVTGKVKVHKQTDRPKTVCSSMPMLILSSSLLTLILLPKLRFSFADYYCSYSAMTTASPKGFVWTTHRLVCKLFFCQFWHFPVLGVNITKIFVPRNEIMSSLFFFQDLKDRHFTDIRKKKSYNKSVHFFFFFGSFSIYYPWHPLFDYVCEKNT